MQLSTFLAQAKRSVPGTFFVFELVCASEFSLTFEHVKRLISKIKERTPIHITPAQLTSREYAVQLSTPFLGREQFFVLDGVVSGSSLVGVTSLLKKYQGPHTILYATQRALLAKSQLAQQLSVIVPCKIGIREIEKYALLFKASARRLSELISRLDFERPTLSLDQLCQADRYVACISAETEREALAGMLSSVFYKQSLFLISDVLLSRDIARFFACWSRQKRLFSVQFWIFYFSEQCWLAYQFILAKRKSQSVEKLYERRLPFSFTRSGGWKRWDMNQLVAMHDALLCVDQAIKQGAGEDMLESILQLALTNSDLSCIESVRQGLGCLP